ncbi:cytidine deaminase-like protein [Schizophyllum amplum]|uniref:Cytosine deaminase n=1 Tax=Schizophyllum amplum TaxID=97359 RepID=A0A550CYI6_9AGAR|nr:cytidine deaminase-like protein [Auriculariopsis ampla]
MPPIPADRDALGMQRAFEEAEDGAKEGGIPIGSALVLHDDNGDRILASGRNMRIQKSSATLHGEICCLETAGRLKAGVYRKCTIYTTLSPCIMCTGAILLYRIPRVVIGENTNYVGGEELLKQNGVEVIVRNDSQCKELMAKFIKERPEDWNEDVGDE